MTHMESTEASAEKLDALMRRIRGLLAKAESTTFPAEADALRAKAEALMAQYRIDEITSAPQGGLAIHWRDIDVCSVFSEYRHHYYNLAYTLVTHVGVRCKLEYNWSTNQMVLHVCGYESDLRWLELLLAECVLEFGKRMEPTVDPNESDQVNAYRLRASGMEGKRIAIALWGDDKNSLRAKARKMYKVEAEARGEDPSALLGQGVNVLAYRLSYAQGFVNRFNARLHNMRIARAEQAQEIVLQGRTEAISEAFYERYPEARPKASESTTGPLQGGHADCAKCARAKSGYCREHSYLRPSRARARGLRLSEAAYARGARAADQVDLGVRGRLDG